MPNLPYGDAFIVQTPALNRVGQQLYQEQQQRKQMAYQDYLATQQTLQKEFQNVRSADVGEVYSLYDKYKSARQDLLFNNKVKNNRQLYSQRQQEANEAQTKLQQLINNSIDLKDQDANLSQDIFKNHDLYIDGAGSTLASWMQLPTTQRVQNGYIGNTPLVDNSINYDFTGLEKKAAGEKGNTYQPETLSSDKLSYIQKGFNRGNNPLQFASIYIAGLGDKKAAKATSAAYKLIPDEDKQAVEDSFNEIPDSEWQKWGIPKPNLSQVQGQSDSEKFAIMMAQKYAIENPPQEADTKSRRNDAAYLAAENQYATQRLAVAQQYKKAYHDYTNASNNVQQGQALGNLVQTQIDKSNVKRNINIGGQEYQTKQIAIPIQIASEYTKALNKPDAVDKTQLASPQGWFITTDGKYLIPLYDSGKKTKSGSEIHNTSKADMIPVSNYLADLGRLYLSKKQAGEELGDDDFTDETSTVPQTNKVQPLSNGGYTNITETNKGKIGLKNGKWYDMKTGKPIE